MPGGRPTLLCFGPFEADLASRELRKAGAPLKLQDQPFRVLQALVERPGEVVSREELRELIWGGDTYVDFDKSLSAAVNKVRQALDDSRTRPRYIETIPKVGYRFIAAMEPPTPSSSGDRSSGASRATAGPRRWTWAGIAAAFAAAATAWYLWSPADSVPAPPLLALNFTSYDGVELSPTFSPDGSQIAFVGEGGGQHGLYIKSIGAEEAYQRISDPAGHLYAPAWSPSGHAIAYMLATTDGRYEIRMVPPAGGVDRFVGEIGPPGEPQLTLAGFATPLAWSPNSRFLAAPATTEPGAAQAIFLIETSSGERRRLTFPEANTTGDSHPRFSTTGGRLAFVRGASGLFTSQLYVLDLDEAMVPVGAPQHVPVRAEQPLAWVLGPIWTHDDSEIVVAATGGLRRLASDGSGLATPLGLGSNSGLASLSGNGRKLVFQQYQLDWDVWRFDRRSGRPRPLINSTLADHSARFSPTGDRIAWTSARSGFSEIWVCRADGADAVQLTSLEKASGTAVWSPDGATIAFDSQTDDGGGDIFLIAAEGGPPRPLTSDAAHDLTPAWAPGGADVYFASNRDGEYRIWSVGVDDGEPRRVSDSPGRFPVASADGEFLYFGSWPESEGRRLIRKRLPDGPESIVLEEVGSWTLGQTDLYFTATLDSTTIRRRDLESGKEVAVFEWDKPVGRIDLSPDEQTILFGQTDNQVDLMLVEDFR